MYGNFGGYLHAREKMSMSLWLSVSPTIKKKISKFSASYNFLFSDELHMWMNTRKKMYRNKKTMQLNTSVQEVSVQCQLSKCPKGH